MGSEDRSFTIILTYWAASSFLLLQNPFSLLRGRCCFYLTARERSLGASGKARPLLLESISKTAGVISRCYWPRRCCRNWALGSFFSFKLHSRAWQPCSGLGLSALWLLLSLLFPGAHTVWRYCRPVFSLQHFHFSVAAYRGSEGETRGKPGSFGKVYAFSKKQNSV